MSTSSANSHLKHVWKPQSSPNRNALLGQHFAFDHSSCQTDPAGISVGASQHLNLENNHKIRGTPNLLVSLADNAMEAGSEPQCHLHKDINVQLRLSDNQIPSGGKMLLTMPQFVVEVPKSMTFECWKREILKEMEAQLDNVGNIELPVAGKVTIGNKRAVQTDSSKFGEHILKHKKVQGATEIDFSNDGSIVQEPHNSEGISHAGIKSSTNALANEISTVRNQTAPDVTQKSTCMALSPQVEAQNVDSAHQTSESSQRRSRKFSLDEMKLLMDAVGKYGVGGWQLIKQEVFRASDRTYNELKEKWRSLVKTANIPPEKRRGIQVPQEVLDKVAIIDENNKRQKGKLL